MKSIVNKIVYLLLFVCLLSVLILSTACQKNNGGSVEYEIIPSTEDYVPDYRPSSGATLDDGITIDGNFDDAVYSNLKWITLSKVDGTQTATVKMTVSIGKNGLLIAADVVENTLITYNAIRPTAYESGLEMYIAFGDSESWRDGLYEVDLTAAERFGIRKYTALGYVDCAVAYDTSPMYKVVREGSIKDNACTGYRFELFMPYALFGRTGRCNEVYVNPTHIAMPDWELTEVRNWYNFGGRQSSLYDWSAINQGYTFNRNGAVINRLKISNATGGTVTEEFGYDYCITDDVVNLKIQPENGYKLSSLVVNGKECVNDVVSGAYSFKANGDTTVVPTFEVVEVSRIQANDVYAWLDYPASEFNVVLNNGESTYELEYDSTKLQIDMDNHTIKALAEGKFEVKVTSGTDTASFFVTCSKVNKSGGNWQTSNADYDKVNGYKDKYATDGENGKTTVFIGDSFFDTKEGFWSDFYNAISDQYNALSFGVGGSTTFDWENFISRGYLDGMNPKNLVVNLGTNNFGGDNCTVDETAECLQRLFTLLHEKMPETQIYYFSIAQRYDTLNHSLSISSCNDLMKEWCEYKDWITFVDVEDKLSSVDLKDGLHPKNETYRSVYIAALEKAGAFKDEEK